MAFDIQEELKKLPGKPGVYLMHDADDTIIYVGKAISLKNRVRQYFQTSRNKGPKIERMVTHIARFEYIVTDSELEALVLECNLIKEHRPKYNTMLKDDKAYPYIKVTVNEDFPRILFSHQMKKDKAKYFGPYTSAGAVKDTIELLRKLYDIRSCNKSLPKEIGKDRPCLYYHIHQCKAPCQGYISKEEYGEQIKKAISFLNGNYNDMIKELTGKMTEAAEEMRFEQAAEYRDLIDSVRRIGERQKITNSDGEDKDVIALAMDKEDAVAQVFFIRNGKLIGREHYYLRIGEEEQKSEVLLTFMKQFYSGTPFIPREIMISEEIAEQELMEEYLSSKRGQKVRIRVPKKGSKEKMVELAEEKDKAAYEGLALFIKSYKIFYISMQLGDVPYSEALKGDDGLVKPKYDTQESVMINLINDLEKAASLFDKASNFEGDPILNGDITKWRKVVDAFRLKMLLYLSKKENHTELRIKDRFAQIVTSGNLMSSNNDNFQLEFSDKAGQIYPFNKIVSKHYMYTTISSVVVDSLKAYDDYRLFYFAKPAAALIASGLKANDKNAYVGLDPVADFSDLQSQSANGNCCTLNARYTDLITGEPYVRIGYAEQCFILAEAVLRGWITGNASDYYNKGIRAAMEFIANNTPDEEKYHSGRQITDEYITQYLQNNCI